MCHVLFTGKKRTFIFTHMRTVLKNLVYTPAAHLVKLIIEDKVYDAVLKDMQFHPVKDNILHADFIEIHDKKPVVINIPIKVSGDSVGVIAGGKLSIKKKKPESKRFR